MTHSFNTSYFSSPIPAVKRERRQIFWCEVIDFDNESTEFEVEAFNFTEANSKAESIAYAKGLQINFINIYKY